ncbi:hypothetical protein L2729_21065 [Shewanella gelidimarina]|uniref:hypothetical protein n=1 Tax=Shewanella gelidimarina TaxID=56813 RepID=UPI00200C0758|nr:hypothetical protein [Shewanella gelidimarina]MCL1060458.1 hypothetical protein [Shewanella gelidimarina]
MPLVSIQSFHQFINSKPQIADVKKPVALATGYSLSFETKIKRVATGNVRLAPRHHGHCTTISVVLSFIFCCSVSSSTQKPQITDVKKPVALATGCSLSFEKLGAWK